MKDFYNWDDEVDPTPATIRDKHGVRFDSLLWLNTVTGEAEQVEKDSNGEGVLHQVGGEEKLKTNLITLETPVTVTDGYNPDDQI